jgi:hypothetical protein
LQNELDKPLNIFYAEPETDRWIKYDRYPRKWIRRLVRGKKKPGGVAMVAINLKKGLDKLNIPYRFNDFAYIKKHPDEIACIVGMSFLLFERKWKNPAIFGAGIYSHPMDYADVLTKYPNVKRILVPGEWMRKMFEPYYHDKVLSWPVGIDTELWSPAIKGKPEFDFLVYDKVRWKHDEYERELINPILAILAKLQLSYTTIRYGSYSHPELLDKLKKSRNAIFLCEHETQGLAYQQILATGTPVLAWERGGYWQDPYYYPHKVKFEPVSAVPYWDERCGLKFSGAVDFEAQLLAFLQYKKFKPEAYILENLSLEKCAEKYLDIYRQVEGELR